jgi:hypothetical protein
MNRRYDWSKGVRPAVIALLLVAASFAANAHGADPLVTVGSVTTPGGGTTASGAVGSGGTTDACVNGQHSGANPGTAGTSGDAAQINDAACAAQASSGAGGTGTGGTSSRTAGTSGDATRSGASVASAPGGTARALPAWVFASQASGVRIVRVRYLTGNAAATKRFRVLVTVRDVRGRLVRHAIVSTGRVAGARTTVADVRSAYTDRQGQARVAIRVTTPMLGRQLLLRITARTPSARALRIGSVFLPTAFTR